MSANLLRQGIQRLGLEAARMRFALPTTPRPLDPGRALAGLPPEPDVLFLCYGNICRSPMAERYARMRTETDAVDYDSAGFHDPEDRPSPKLAVRAGFDRGVDLSAHRSDRVTKSALEASDLTLVMDVRNYRRLAREFPDHLPEAWFLKPFGRFGGAAIPDPYDGDRETFDRVYRQVAASVEGLAGRLDADR